jgi:hypothetical protein
MEAAKCESLEIVTLANDNRGLSLSVIYNFHEGSGPFRPDVDEGLSIDDSRYSLSVVDSDRFILSNNECSMRFRRVGDWQRWANQAVIAGTYKDAKGQAYVFRPDGTAQFPGNREFDYNVGLDMILTNYDYIYSETSKRTWAIATMSGGVTLFHVDLSGNELEGVVSSSPQWKLERVPKR